MNNKGTMLVETTFILILLVILLTSSETISRGWALRIQNRMAVRYASTFQLRKNALLSEDTLNKLFFYQDFHKIRLVGDDTLDLHFKRFLKPTPLRFTHHYYLWRPQKYDFPLFKIPF